MISLSDWQSLRVALAVPRCGNLFGGGDLNFNRLIPGTIRSAHRDKSPVIRSDGTFVRDYFYVRDAVDAYLQLAEHMPNERFLGQAFNFGTETPLSVVEVAESILRMMGKPKPSLTILNEATNEIPRQYLDCAKARATMSWHPRFTFEQGMTESIAWYRDLLDRQDSGPRRCHHRLHVRAAVRGQESKLHHLSPRIPRYSQVCSPAMICWARS